MTELNPAQMNEIRSKVLGAAAKVPGALIGLGILFIVLGMIGVAGQTLFSFVSINILGIFLFAGGVLQGAHAFQSHGLEECERTNGFGNFVHCYCNFYLDISNSGA